MLPDFMVPYKHYPEETIAGVLDEVVSCNDSDTEEFPTESTMKRWEQWFIRNMANMDGHLKSVAYRVLGFSEEHLGSGMSLLQQIRSSLPHNWLQIVLQYIYNLGNRLLPFY